jgi:hypothetical protein
MKPLLFSPSRFYAVWYSSLRLFCATLILWGGGVSAQDALVLDKEKAYFHEDCESSYDINKKWKVDGSPRPVIKYNEGNAAASDGRSIYYFQPDSTGYKVLSSKPHIPADAWKGQPAEYGYGAQIRFMVPDKGSAMLPNEDFRQLTILRLQSAEKVFASVVMAKRERSSVTDDEIEISTRGRLPGRKEVDYQYRTIARGKWHSLQIDHLDGGPEGVPLYLNGDLWVFLPEQSEFVERVQLGNTKGSAEDSSGEIFYDDILISRP